MIGFIIRRLVYSVVIIAASTVLIYFLLTLIPGSPLAALYMSTGPHKLSLAEIHAIGHLWGLLDAQGNLIPWYQRYFTWLFSPDRAGIDVTLGAWHIHGGGMLTGDWGVSTFVAPTKPTLQLMGERLPFTLILMGGTMLLSLLIGLPMGILGAVKQYSRLDYTLTLFGFAGISLPGFWLAWMLILVFGVTLRTWGLPHLPISGAYDVEMQGDLWNRFTHLILPMITLTIPSLAGWSRFLRSQLLEVLRLDYVRTAWAKGLRPRAVILKHALRNALGPMITLFTLSLPVLFGGTVIVESVFSYPGMGQLYITALSAYDWTVVMGYLLVTTTLIVLANLLADVLYAVADPRIRYT